MLPIQFIILAIILNTVAAVMSFRDMQSPSMPAKQRDRKRNLMIVNIACIIFLLIIA